MGTNEHSVQFAGGTLGRHRHICAFFNSIDEQHRVLRSFIKDGFDRGEKAFHFVDPERREEHLKRLAEAGIDVERAMGSGQLEVRLWQDAQLRGDRFDQDAMLALIRRSAPVGPSSRLPAHEVSGAYGMGAASTNQASMTCLRRIRDTRQLCASQVRRSGDLCVRSVEV